MLQFQFQMKRIPNEEGIEVVEKGKTYGPDI